VARTRSAGARANIEEAGSMNPTGIGGFSKGQSGDPGGRRKKTAEDIEIQQFARQHGATAIDALVKIAIRVNPSPLEFPRPLPCLTEALEKRPSQLKAM
jgi:hypothetical protein